MADMSQQAPRLDWNGVRGLVTGGTGFVGTNLLPKLRALGCRIIAPSRAECDLLEQDQVRRLFKDVRPEVVFHLAGLVGGILANKRSPAEYCHQNLLMGTLVLRESWKSGVAKYITLIGGCSYPAKAPSPISESSLWEGYPQAESAAYSLAKRMALVEAQAYRQQHGFDAIVLAPGNLYGPHDNFDLENSHVIPALIRKFSEAQERKQPEVVVWGTGRPTRDFVYVADACEAILLAAQRYSGPEVINISSGQPVTIRELVETVREQVGYGGRVSWDATKPDGQMEKAFDVSRMREWLGYECRTGLRDGLRKTMDWLSANHPSARLKTAL